MRLIKMFGLAAMAAVSAMAFVGATSASATNTQLCTAYTGLLCGAGNGATSVHTVLVPGTVLLILGVIDVLCLGFLMEATPLGLGNPQSFHSLSQSFTGCGTSNTHNNCTVTIPAGQQPLLNLLKVGLDIGVLTGTSGQLRVVCGNIGLDCLYDLAGTEFEVGGGELVANETIATELGGKFFCPDEAVKDAWLETLGDAYVLG
jgi:hypothetical protein